MKKSLQEKLKEHIASLIKRKEQYKNEIHAESLRSHWITANQLDIKMRVIDSEINDLLKLL